MTALLLQSIAGVTARSIVAPTLVITEWAKRARIVSFALTVPLTQQVVTITATLTAPKAVATATVHATNANAVTGMQLPLVPSGRYGLTLTLVDNRGGTASAIRPRVEVTT